MISSDTRFARQLECADAARFGQHMKSMPGQQEQSGWTRSVTFDKYRGARLGRQRRIDPRHRSDTSMRRRELDDPGLRGDQDGPDRRSFAASIGLGPSVARSNSATRSILDCDARTDQGDEPEASAKV